jgi:hypothetical protein
MDNLKIYNALKQPPKEALKTIQAGRLRGMSDINPQWRYKAMTEQFGVCGIGWKYEIEKVWSEPQDDGQVFAFAKINLYIRDGEKWSDVIPAIGGSMLVSKESAGLHASDEGYKMAVTDALGTAMKMLGVAADIYAGMWDGAKYRDTIEAPAKPVSTPAETPQKSDGITPPQTKKIHATAKEKNLSAEEARAYMQKTFKKNSTKELTKDEASTMIEFLVEIKPDDMPLVRAAKEMGAKEE